MVVEYFYHGYSILKSASHCQGSSETLINKGIQSTPLYYTLLYKSLSRHKTKKRGLFALFFDQPLTEGSDPSLLLADWVIPYDLWGHAVTLL